MTFRHFDKFWRKNFISEIWKFQNFEEEEEEEEEEGGGRGGGRRGRGGGGRERSCVRLGLC